MLELYLRLLKFEQWFDIFPQFKVLTMCTMITKMLTGLQLLCVSLHHLGSDAAKGRNEH